MFDRLPMLPMLPAADLDRARQWYRDHLELEPTVELPDQEINVFPTFLSYRSQYAGTAQNTAAAWLASDFDAALAILTRHGVRLETYDMPELEWRDGVATGPDGMRAAWFKDSEGNILSLVEPPEAIRAAAA